MLKLYGQNDSVCGSYIHSDWFASTCFISQFLVSLTLFYLFFISVVLWYCIFLFQQYWYYGIAYFYFNSIGIMVLYILISIMFPPMVFFLHSHLGIHNAYTKILAHGRAVQCWQRWIIMGTSTGVMMQLVVRAWLLAMLVLGGSQHCKLASICLKLGQTLQPLRDKIK